MKPKNTGNYFPYDIQLSKKCWENLALDAVRKELLEKGSLSTLFFFRELSSRFNKAFGKTKKPVTAGLINIHSTVLKIFRHIINQYMEVKYPSILDKKLASAGLAFHSDELFSTVKSFAELFPCKAVIDKKLSPYDFLAANDHHHSRKKAILKELLILWIEAENPAVEDFRELFNDTDMGRISPYNKFMKKIEEMLKTPLYKPFNMSLLEMLRAPIKASPHSLEGQLDFIRKNWLAILPEELLAEILTAFDIAKEETRKWHGGGAGPSEVLEFVKKTDTDSSFGEDSFYPEPEKFSPDRDWMSNVVLIAKMVYVWLDQLSKKYGYLITRLDRIPDEELDILARRGFTGLWLIGIWERSPASEKIKHMTGNIDAIASAYSVYDYVAAEDLGGEDALNNLKERAMARGIRLACDMVPNHTGIYSKWTVNHPDWYIQLDHPPFPSYSFTGENLSFNRNISLFIEDGYLSKTDAAVVFKYVDNYSGKIRYIYHGNDGTSTPWNDTAQLNYLLAEVREAVIQTIIHVARKFSVIRFDAAMTLAKKHYQRLWFPQPGHGGSIPSRSEYGLPRKQFEKLFPVEFWREVVDRIAAEVPDTLLIAEAFWLMEGYFVRTLGMHRVYNSAFMNMLKMEENAKYRQTVKNVLEFNPQILKRFVNFMNNPDERTAVEQFGKEGKYIGVAIMLVTMPGLPMFGHGQIEGFSEKYGMEYKREYLNETPDSHLIWLHETQIFPLMKKRHLFSGSENFVFYDFISNGHIDNNVFAYSNASGGEKALVIYHNKFGTTKGWIKNSTTIASTGKREEPPLIRKTFGSGLGLKRDGRCYYRFKDHATGLEYLRHSIELHEKGVYSEMDAYQYHVFLDFHEIWDDDFGNWGRLCRKLNGRGAANLYEEFKQIRYEKVLNSFGKALIFITEKSGLLLNIKKKDAEIIKDIQANRELLDLFFKEAAEHTGMSYDVHTLSESVVAKIILIKKIKPFKIIRGSVLKNEKLLSLFLLLHFTGLPENSKDYPLYSLKMIDELGLYRAVEESLLPPYPLLLIILIAQRQFFYKWNEKSGKSRIKTLFNNPDVKKFLNFNIYEGIEWFNKERFEELLKWLYFIAKLKDEAESAQTLDSSFRIEYKSVMKLIKTAEKANYRVDKFLSYYI